MIDFAHTADSYEKLFGTIESIGSIGHLTVVMGAAGRRDRTKRAAMGRIAASAADLLIITEEDPRDESEEQIADDLLSEVDRRRTTILQIPKRRSAIRTAIERAEAGDVVLLLGKGHERSIQRKNETIAWDERAVARRALAKKEQVR